MNRRLSIVTACYNDSENFVSTMASLRGEMEPSDEILIIDSSADSGLIRRLAGDAGLPCSYRYIWMPPAGIYPAQNRGIYESAGEWIQVVNSGDRLCSGARNAIAGALSAFPDVKVHVFRGRAIAPNVKPYVFSPTARSVWPHQSIITHKSVYELEGLYPEEYRLCAEQMYFAKVRRTQQWMLHTAVLSEYLLGGLSSSIRYPQLRDAYVVSRTLGQSAVRGMLGAFVLPIARKSLEYVFGLNFVNKLKCSFFSYYSRE
jgi:hypothetical protein